VAVKSKWIGVMVILFLQGQEVRFRMTVSNDLSPATSSTPFPLGRFAAKKLLESGNPAASVQPLIADGPPDIQSTRSLLRCMIMKRMISRLNCAAK